MSHNIKMLLACLTALIASPMIANAQGANFGAIGEREYKASCAVCHGMDGRGQGDFVGILKVQPADLTKLSKNNQGRFPYDRVLQVIDGRATNIAHGTRDMPIWGERYAEEIGENVGPSCNAIAVRARELELMFYLQSIQEM